MYLKAVLVYKVFMIYDKMQLERRLMEMLSLMHLSPEQDKFYQFGILFQEFVDSQFLSKTKLIKKPISSTILSFPKRNVFTIYKSFILSLLT